MAAMGTTAKTVHARDDQSVVVRHDSSLRWFREFHDGTPRVLLTATSAAVLVFQEGMTVLPPELGGEKSEVPEDSSTAPIAYADLLDDQEGRDRP